MVNRLDRWKTILTCILLIATPAREVGWGRDGEGVTSAKGSTTSLVSEGISEGLAGVRLWVSLRPPLILSWLKESPIASQVMSSDTIQ